MSASISASHVSRVLANAGLRPVAPTSPRQGIRVKRGNFDSVIVSVEIHGLPNEERKRIDEVREVLVAAGFVTKRMTTSMLRVTKPTQWAVTIERDDRVSVIVVEAANEKLAREQAEQHIGLKITVEPQRSNVEQHSMKVAI